MDGHHGTLNGATIAAGRVGNAFRFDGINDFVSMPDSPDWTLGDGDFTIDLWANFFSLPWGRAPLVDHNEGPGSWSKWVLWYDMWGHRPPGGPGLRFHTNYYPDGPALDPVVALWQPEIGRWYHLAVTRQGSTYRIYIDGILKSEEEDSNVIPDANIPLSLGQSEGQYFFHGLIDEVEIFHRALSGSELAAIYRAGALGKCLIDIKPGSDPNSINCANANALIAVALLTQGGFDATAVAPATVRFGRTGYEASEVHGKGHVEDVDKDGDLDMVFHFRFRDTGLRCGDTAAYLTGRTLTGVGFRSGDAIRTVGQVGKACVEPPPGLIAWWPGDGSADDVVGSHPGTLVGDATYTAGMVGQAFDIPNTAKDPDNDYFGTDWVRVDDSSDWDFGTNAFTIDLWVWFDSVFSDMPHQQPLIGHSEGPGGTDKWILWLDAGNLSFHTHPQGGGPGFNPLTFAWYPTTARWYHVAVARDGALWRLFVDGELVQAMTDDRPDRPVPNADTDLTLGRAEDTWLEGRLDEVEIFHRALTAEEIASLFRAGSAGKCKP